MKPILAAAILLLAACSPEAAPEPVLTPEGLGPIKIGMTADAAETTLGVKLFAGPRPALTDDGCTYGRRVDGKDPEIGYMFEKGRITRIDVLPGKVTESKVVTQKGFGIGSREADVVKAYGAKLQIQLHPYLEKGQGSYLVVDAPDHQSGIIFETEHGTVTSFRGGNYPALGYKEGCG